MKMKDVITIVVAVALIGVSGYFMYKMLAPVKSTQTTTSNEQKQNTKFTGVIDEETLKTITEKKDYGEATLDNIGRTNPFGPLN